MFRYPRRVPVTAPSDDEIMTKQSSKDECDIYNILKQYQRTGVLTHIANAQPTFEDLPDLTDYQGALNQVMAADDAFQALPASVRDEFGNNPTGFLKALGDPARAARLRELGILKPLPIDTKAPGPTEPAA